MRRITNLLAVGAVAVVAAACSHDQVLTTPPSVLVVTTTTQPPTTTSTAPPTTVTVPPTTPLPTPVPPPAEDGTSEDTNEVGTIEIPKTGLRSPMYEGIRLSTLDRGPGHWPGSAMPGELGNVVVAGHRTSHNAEFRDLDALSAGDEVIMHTMAGRFVYRVASTEIVTPEALWIVDQTPTPTATLFACHPPGSVDARIVVHMELAA